MREGYHERTIYLVLSETEGISLWRKLKLPILRGSKPAIGGGEVAVRLDLQVPKAMFDTFIPGGTLRIPTDMAEAGAIDVEVEDTIVADSGVRFKLVPITQTEEDDEDE